jgi:hypothetical protein
VAEQSPDINEDAQEQQPCNIPASRESRNPDLVDTLNLFKNILDDLSPDVTIHFSQ